MSHIHNIHSKIKRNNATFFFGDAHTGSLDHNTIAQYDFNNFILQPHCLKHLVLLKQVHGAEGVCVSSRQTLSKSLSIFEELGDFLVTNRSGVGIGVLTADCLPVIAVDERRQVIGIAHAGWRGTILGVVERMIKTMNIKFSSDPSDLKISFGPSAQTCCYEVQNDFLHHVEKFSFKEEILVRRDGKLFFDGPRCNELQLVQLGIKPENIKKDQNHCTICNYNFNSFRRQGAASFRQLSMVWIN